MIFSEEIQVQTINHLGLIAGIIDEIGIDFSHLDSTSFAVEGKYSQEKISENFVKENRQQELINQIPIKIIKGYSRSA